MGERQDVCRRRFGCIALKGRKRGGGTALFSCERRLGRSCRCSQSFGIAHRPARGRGGSDVRRNRDGWRRGGRMEQGRFQRKIHESAARQQWQMEQYCRVTVGVNEFIPRMATRSTCGIRLTIRIWFRQGRPTCGGRLQSYMMSGTLRIRIRQFHRLCVSQRTKSFRREGKMNHRFCAMLLEIGRAHV